MARTGTSENTGERYTTEVAEFLSGRRQDLPAVLQQLEASADTLCRMAALLTDALRNGHKILTAGNGGSAAEAQHFSAELVGRFKRDRAPYPAIALNTDTSIITALANDYSYEDVFARQVDALARPGDIFLAYSTSGESKNLIRAAHAAHERGAQVVSLTGSKQNRLAQIADLAILVPSSETPIVQEVHLMVTHLVCGIVESELTQEDVS